MAKNPRPYKGVALCDAHVGVDYSQRCPKILRCKNTARFLWQDDRGYVYKVCPDCLVRFQADAARRLSKETPP